jgi:thiamine pyrophosphate-dependent acetolactate synthase large subunit-like protein
MGEALLASLGIRLASGVPTLALVGDWGFCMAPHELHTAVELGLSGYVVVVWSNGGGAFIGAGVAQQGLRVPDPTWRWAKPIDFVRLAEGLGARGVVVTEANELSRAVATGLADDRPLLIDAKIDPNAAVPAGDRFLTLGVEHA